MWALAAVLAVAYTAAHAALAASPSTRLGTRLSTTLGAGTWTWLADPPRWLGAGPLDVATRAQRFHREHVEGAYALEHTAEGIPFRWTGDVSRFVLPAETRWLVVRLWAHHPDIEEDPVKVAIVSPCGTAFEGELRSTRPVSVGLALPPSAEAVDATIYVSRTWMPADQGAADTRRLGVGVLTEFVPSEELGRAQDYVEEWPDCPAG